METETIPTTVYAEYIKRKKASNEAYEEALESGEERVMPLYGRLGDLDTDSFESVSVHTPIAANNVGHKLLMKMGWKSGTGLGRSGQGRLEPVNVVEKREVMGLGRMTMEMDKAKETTEQRKLLDVELTQKLDPEKVAELQKKWKAKAERDVNIAAEIKEVNKVFLCEICNKQYTKVSEYDNHLSSYDHHHTKRLKDLRDQDRKAKQKYGSTSKRKRKEEKREMKRINKMIAAAGGSVGQWSSSSSNTKGKMPAIIKQPVAKAIAKPPTPSCGGWATSSEDAQGSAVVNPSVKRATGGWGSVDSNLEDKVCSSETSAIPKRGGWGLVQDGSQTERGGWGTVSGTKPGGGGSTDSTNRGWGLVKNPTKTSSTANFRIGSKPFTPDSVTTPLTSSYQELPTDPGTTTASRSQKRWISGGKLPASGPQRPPEPPRPLEPPVSSISGESSMSLLINPAIGDSLPSSSEVEKIESRRRKMQAWKADTACSPAATSRSDPPPLPPDPAPQLTGGTFSSRSTISERDKIDARRRKMEAWKAGINSAPPPSRFESPPQPPPPSLDQAPAILAVGDSSAPQTDRSLEAAKIEARKRKMEAWKASRNS